MRHVFIYSSGVFTSKESDCPKIPYFRDSLDELPASWTPSDGREPEWATNSHPFLGYALVDPMWKSFLMSPLSHRPPINTQSSRFYIPQESIKNWFILEVLLLRVGYVLLGDADKLFPLTFSYPRLPTTFGIKSTYPTM